MSCPAINGPGVLGRDPTWRLHHLRPARPAHGNFIRGPKYAIFLSYGADNVHSREHRLYYIENRKELGYADYPSELAAKLREEDLFLKIS